MLPLRCSPSPECPPCVSQFRISQNVSIGALIEDTSLTAVYTGGKARARSVLRWFSPKIHRLFSKNAPKFRKISQISKRPPQECYQLKTHALRFPLSPLSESVARWISSQTHRDMENLKIGEFLTSPTVLIAVFFGGSAFLLFYILKLFKIEQEQQDQSKP